MPLTDLRAYRVVSRRTVAVLFGGGFCAGALLMWIGLTWIEIHSARISALVLSDPEQALGALARDLRVVALLHGIPVWASAAYLCWYGYRGIQTQSMPPLGSWIVAGQRIRKGREAVTASKLMVLAAGLLTLLVIGSSVVLWNFAAGI